MGRRVAVIASNCFSGGHCVDALLAEPGTEVLGINRSPEKSRVFLPYKKRGDVPFRFVQADLNTRHEEAMAALDDFRPELVINFAAQGEVGTSWKHPVHWFQTNAVAITALADALRRRDYLKRFVQISTPEVYGSCEGSVPETTPMDPSTPYAASKGAGDLFLLTLFKQYRFPLLTVRSTNVYGPHQQLYRILPRSIINLRKGVRIPLHGGGKAYKAYLHIRDAVAGILAAAERGREGEVYHFSPDEDISIRDLVARVCRLMGKDFESAVEVAAERPGQDKRYSISSEKARRELSWKPSVALDEGIREMIDWLDADWESIKDEPTEYIHRR